MSFARPSSRWAIGLAAVALLASAGVAQTPASKPMSKPATKPATGTTGTTGASPSVPTLKPMSDAQIKHAVSLLGTRDSSIYAIRDIYNAGPRAMAFVAAAATDDDPTVRKAAANGFLNLRLPEPAYAAAKLLVLAATEKTEDVRNLEINNASALFMPTHRQLNQWATTLEAGPTPTSVSDSTANAVADALVAAANFLATGPIDPESSRWMASAVTTLAPVAGPSLARALPSLTRLSHDTARVSGYNDYTSLVLLRTLQNMPQSSSPQAGHTHDLLVAGWPLMLNRIHPVTTVNDSIAPMAARLIGGAGTEGVDSVLALYHRTSSSAQRDYKAYADSALLAGARASAIRAEPVRARFSSIAQALATACAAPASTPALRTTIVTTLTSMVTDTAYAAATHSSADPEPRVAGLKALAACGSEAKTALPLVSALANGSSELADPARAALTVIKKAP